MREKKFVYQFEEGNETMKELLGGKGSNLSQMIRLGLSVPTGFTVTTEACNQYYQDGEKVSVEIKEEILEHIRLLEERTGKKLGDVSNPLLVSVRSGARASMPGMMDTILNLGMSDEIVEAIAKLTDNPKFAYDSYRRFIQMFADVVMEVPKATFEDIIDEMKFEREITLDSEFNEEDLKEMVHRFKQYYKTSVGSDFPTDPIEQVLLSVEAVFRSWNNARAIYYRRMHDIPDAWGTAVNIQMMVFGNMGDDCATGVAFTRNPSTGEAKLYGEYLLNAQGEDVVAGTRTPYPIEELATLLPTAYNEFVANCKILEDHYRDMQDMEFTIEKGKLYMLQTRSGKRTAAAALKIACDLVSENKRSVKEALLMVDPKQLDSLLHPRFEEEALKEAKPIASGLPASPGAACGQVVFSAEKAAEMSKKGMDVILVRLETSPEDIEGMNMSKGILTARGGMTSHAAVVARGMGKCCVSGCAELDIREELGYFLVNGKKYEEMDFISLDGSTGHIYGDILETVDAQITGDFETFMKWSDSYRRLKVRTNADTPKDAKQALEFGAEGIGLIRTEHMFFDGDRIKRMREMIVSKNLQQRTRALNQILPMQREDFIDIFEVMEGRPITVRYLDPPLHEFLPTSSYDIAQLAQDMGVDPEELRQIILSLHEFNPMMGHRGVRLAISYPEIARMQTRAVIEAAIVVMKRHPEWKIVPEIMIPLVGDKNELEFVKQHVDEIAKQVMKEQRFEVEYKVGTMIEIPRAALLADEIAEDAEFFSFGTNDLTQMTFGFSRDDAGGFLSDYYDKRIYEQDPFERIDEKGVGRLVEMATTLGRKVKPKLKVGICGEHGGNPSTIEFCHRIGLDYVSCSPYRVPIARLAAAQAAIKDEE